MARGYQAFLELRWKESAYFEADGFFVTGKTRLKKSQPISRENVIGILLNLDASSPLANTMSMFREPWLITSDGPDFGSMKLAGCGGLLDVWISFAILRHPWQVLLFLFPFDFVQFFALADLATLFSSHSLVVQVMRLPFLNDCEPLWSTIDRPQTQFHKPNAVPRMGYEFLTHNLFQRTWREKRFSRTPPDGSILNLMYLKTLGWRKRANFWLMLWNI